MLIAQSALSTSHEATSFRAVNVPVLEVGEDISLIKHWAETSVLCIDTQLGAIVDEAIAYRTVPETDDITGAKKRFTDEGADLIPFTSSSTVENFVAMKLPWPQGIKTASIGPITSATMKQAGLKVDVEATQHDIDGLVDAILGLLGR